MNDWDKRSDNPRPGNVPATPAEIQALATIYGFEAELVPASQPQVEKKIWRLLIRRTNRGRRIYQWRPVEDWIACLKDLELIR